MRLKRPVMALAHLFPVGIILRAWFFAEDVFVGHVRGKFNAAFAGARGIIGIVAHRGRRFFGTGGSKQFAA